MVQVQVAQFGQRGEHGIRQYVDDVLRELERLQRAQTAEHLLDEERVVLLVIGEQRADLEHSQIRKVVTKVQIQLSGGRLATRAHLIGHRLISTSRPTGVVTLVQHVRQQRRLHSIWLVVILEADERVVRLVLIVRVAIRVAIQIAIQVAIQVAIRVAIRIASVTNITVPITKRSQRQRNRIVTVSGHDQIHRIAGRSVCIVGHEVVAHQTTIACQQISAFGGAVSSIDWITAVRRFANCRVIRQTLIVGRRAAGGGRSNGATARRRRRAAGDRRNGRRDESVRGRQRRRVALEAHRGRRLESGG